MVEIDKHKKDFYCPEHYLLVNPPEEKEKMFCVYCYKPLEFICPTCQSYVEEQQEHYNFLDKLKADIKVANEPIPTMGHPIEKTLQEWKDYQKGKWMDKHDFDKLNSVPEIDKSKKWPWEYFWYILINGWENFSKWLSGKEEIEAKFKEDWEKELASRKVREEQKKQADEEEKKRKKERDEKVIELTKDIDAIKVKASNYINGLLDQMMAVINSSLPLEKKLIPRKVVMLLKLTINKISSLGIDLATIEEFFSKLAGTTSSVLNTKELKIAYKDIIEGTDKLLGEWIDLKNNIDALHQAEKDRYSENPDDGNNWENINSAFKGEKGKKLKEEWTMAGFTFEQVREWIGIGIHPTAVNFCLWLKDVKNFSPEWVLNYGNLGNLEQEYGWDSPTSF